MMITKFEKIAAFALIIALFSIILGMSALQEAEVNNVFEIVVNNTNLAPTFPGHSNGLGIRVTNGVYWTNTTPIELFVFAHAQNVSDTAEVHLHINGTIVQDTSGRPLGSAESSNKSISAIIPLHSNYTVEFINAHHYEWREYSILSGKNGSVNLNITSVSGVNQTELNLKVNKSGDSMSGNLNLTNHYLYSPTSIESNTGQIQINDLYGNNSLIHIQSHFNTIEVTENKTSYIKEIDTSSRINFSTNNQTIRFQSDLAPIPYTVNETMQGASLTQDTSGVARWFHFNISSPVTVNVLSLNISSFSGGGAFRLALYDNSGFAPNNLIVETASTTSSNGWNNVSVANQNLVAGTYWIGMQTQATTVTFYAGTTPGYSRYRVMAYGAFPNPAGSTSDSNGFNMRVGYLVYTAYVNYCLHATYGGTLYVVQC